MWPFVVHNQNRLARLGSGTLLDFGQHLGLFHNSPVPGQANAHRRALPEPRVDANLSAGLLGKAVDHGQTKPAALPERLGCKKRIPSLPVGYPAWLEDLKTDIRQARLRATLAANSELISLYWRIGRDILEREAEQG